MTAICALRSNAALTAVAALLLAPAGAEAAETASEAFTAAGEHVFVVPAGVSSVQVTLVGGNGGAGNGGEAGGVPATVSATLALSAGQTLYVEVAGNGGSATAPDSAVGGYGGGNGGGEVFSLFGTAPSGGGGGGASDIRTCATAAPGCESLPSRLVVAAGGGGGGGNGNNGGGSVAGGAGGAADFPGLGGSSDGSDSPGTGGGEGSAGSGGSAGTGATGGAGALGIGGGGGDTGFVGGGGGGGGGGIYGGGGGGGGLGHTVGSGGYGSGAGGGGGGSSGVLPAASGVVSGFTDLATAHSAQPQVTLSWTRPSPTVITGSPNGVTSSGATLAGTVNANGSQLTDCHFTIEPAPAAGASIPCVQQVGGASTPVGVSAAVTGLEPQRTYTVTLSAASAQGTSSGSARTFTTPTSSAGAAPAAGSAPTITNLRLSAARFRRGRNVAKLAARARSHVRKAPPAATTISFTLSQAATVELTFEAPQRGVLLGRRCTAPSTRHRRGRGCTRYLALSHGVTRAAHSGAERIVFDGVLDGGARLAPGSYRLSLIASSAGASTTAAQHPSFTLLGP